MRKFILPMLLVLVSSGAAAEWVALGSADSGDAYYDIYVNPATIRKSGNMVKTWAMYDYKTTQVSDKGQMSHKAQLEYDCKDERSRLLYISAYSGSMGNGNVVYSSDGIPGNWSPIVPGSVNEGAWKFACGKQ